MFSNCGFNVFWGKKSTYEVQQFLTVWLQGWQFCLACLVQIARPIGWISRESNMCSTRVQHISLLNEMISEVYSSPALIA